jgi:hypothetical protein
VPEARSSFSRFVSRVLQQCILAIEPSSLSRRLSLSGSVSFAGRDGHRSASDQPHAPTRCHHRSRRSSLRSSAICLRGGMTSDKGVVRARTIYPLMPFYCKSNHETPSQHPWEAS